MSATGHAVSSFVQSEVGITYVHLDEVDSPGLYVLFCNQGTMHGNGVSGNADRHFPIIKRPESYADAQLANLLSRLQQVYQGVLICVQESEHLRKELLAAWQRDLNFIGGTLPKGLPNSPALGIQSSNGLSYGEFAVKIRGHLQVRRC